MLERKQAELRKVMSMKMDTDAQTQLINQLQRSIQIFKDSLTKNKEKLAEIHRGDGSNAKDTSKGKHYSDEELAAIGAKIDAAFGLRLRIE